MIPGSPDERTVLEVQGMTCSACVARVERSLLKTPGVKRASVNLLGGSAVVEFTSGAVTPEQLGTKVTSLGYASRPRSSATSRDLGPDPTASRHLVAATGSLAAFAVAMILGAPLMHVHATTSSLLANIAMPFHGALRRLAPGLWEVSPTLLGWLLLVVHLPVVLWWGRPFFVAAAKAARSWAADMNTLVAAGTGSAFLLSLPSVLAPAWLEHHGLPAPLWFESVSGVIGFVSLGKWLEHRARTRTRGSLLELARLVPDHARLLTPEGERSVTPATLLPGDHIRVRVGERVPADGLADTLGLLDESHLTGEPLPREILPGAAVQAGSLVVGRALDLRVERSGEGTTVERIARLVDAAQTSKAPLQRIADRLAERFAPAVLVLALATFLAWVVSGASVVFALTATISVLVAACPCAMGLAVPSALAVALGRAARLGLLVRDAVALEALGRATVVVFDKTGTLTEGRPRLTRTVSAGHLTASDLLHWTAMVETDSTHPLAASVLEACRTQPASEGDLPVPTAPSTTIPGQGVERATDRGILRAGREGWACPLEGLPACEPGESMVHLGLDGRWLGSLGLSDPARPESHALVASLQRRGLRVEILSGDAPAAVEALATTTGADAWTARATPESKAAHVHALRARGDIVVMVGDGINDAAALTGADAGLALESGTAVAFECAHAVVRTPATVAVGIDLGRATVRTVRGNLAWAFGYNIVLLPVAAGALYPLWGWMLSPVLAGAAMSLSSVSVMAHSLRLLAFRPSPLSRQTHA